MVMINW